MPCARYRGQQQSSLCKQKIGIFNHFIELAEEFAHDADQGDFGDFAFTSESLIESFQDRVIADE